MTDVYRRALERIARMGSEEDEWDAVRRFHDCVDVAQKALNPEHKTERQVEHEVRRRDAERVRKLRRSIGAATVFFAKHFGMTGAWVRVVRDKSEVSGCVKVRVLQVVGDVHGTAYRVGGTFSIHGGNLYDRDQAVGWGIPAYEEKL